MSLVVFPFKTEDVNVVIRNVRIAAEHPRVKHILCVGYEREETYHALMDIKMELVKTYKKRIDVIIQERIGNKRPGKGDGMNTALKFFLENTKHTRIHFYDSDIKTFGPNWITKAEEAADLDYPVVRHYFPRSSTDAMVTWMITKTGFCILWPTSELPWIEQPLGGELLFQRKVVKKLVNEKMVQDQSDWGIDTMYTFFTVKYGYPMYETYIQEGKSHKSYGKLTDLRNMVLECFAVIQSLSEIQFSSENSERVEKTTYGGIVHRAEHPDVVPPHITERISYDIEGSFTILLDNWTKEIEELLDLFPQKIRDGMIKNKKYPTFQFMDEWQWYETYLILLKHYDHQNPHWQELLFKLWTTRVLNYTLNVALKGYDYAMRYLYGLLNKYMQRASVERHKICKG